jgi:protein FAM32A
MDDEYAAVQKGVLKLKVKEQGGKKKKKKDKEKKKLEELTASKTKAELAFERAKKKKILQRASKFHKERIMEFNQQLDNLTEHFDIPKVSWTK